MLVNDPARSAVDLYWIPLGAGANVVRISGRLFELISALFKRRPRADLYHAALIVRVDGAPHMIEQAPVPDLFGDRRGVVAEGPVGTRFAGRLRIFRYEVRRWKDGSIPDLPHAVGGPVRLTDDPHLAQAVLDTLPAIPTPVWGRDEFGAGEMWNSNSVVSWVLTCSGIDISALVPPSGGRAPGWDAGRFAADLATGEVPGGPGKPADRRTGPQQVR
jgi:hypothetical protein